jgi:hypothetical protein
MSNPHPTKSVPPTSKTSSTQGKPPAFDPALAMDVLNRMSEELSERREEMKSVSDFHQALKGAKNDDLRIYWDVRIVRGEDTPFHSVQGISSLPGIMSSKMLAHAPSMIQQEVSDKIGQPLTAVFMEEGEMQNYITTQVIEAHEESSIQISSGGGDAIGKIAEKMATILPADHGADADD